MHLFSKINTNNKSTKPDLETFIYYLPINMCMRISKEDIIRINHGFGGDLRSDSSLDYANELQKSKKLGKYKKLAYLFRAILVDHPFSDGNKRTAAYLALEFAKEYNLIVNNELLMHHIVAIAKKNLTNIRDIEWRLKNAIR